MKNYITLLFIALSPIFFSQSTLTIFNNGGQQFYVIMNGIKQNSIAQTNVSVAGIKNGSYSVKLIFADGKTADIDKNFFLEESSYVTTKVIFKKGKGKLQLIGMEPANGQAPAENQVTYRPTDSVVYSDAIVITQSTSQQLNQLGTNNVQTQVSNGQQQNGVNTSVNVQETQTVNQTTTVTDPATNGNVGININMNVQDPTLNNGQGGVNMSINMSGDPTQQQTQNVQTTTTTTTSTTVNSTNNTNQQSTITKPNTTPLANTTPIKQTAVTCKNILSDENAMITDLQTMTFEDDRMEIVRKDLANYCLTASQAYKLVEIFTFEENRFELAKYLYDRMIDKDKANTLLTLFTFDDTKMQYREYIRK